MEVDDTSLHVRFFDEGREYNTKETVVFLVEKLKLSVLIFTAAASFFVPSSWFGKSYAVAALL